MTAGVLALVCDSTNVFQELASGSEAGVRSGLDDVVGGVEGRVLVTTFASNAARLKTLGHVAQDTGRQVCIAGRSLDRILRVSKSVGYLTDFPETVDFDTAMRLPRRELMIIATGGQGEPRAALARIAFDQHKLKLDRGDLVVFSSKQIPGNEIPIGRIQNELAGKGIEMITDRQAPVHVSGHPGRPELAAMYDWIRPEIIVPVHGEMRHMMEHARFARSRGIPHGIVQKNGDLVRLAPGGPEKIGEESVGRFVLDGDVILPADGSTMNERRRLAFAGLISVAVALDEGDRVKGDVRDRPAGHTGRGGSRGLPRGGLRRRRRRRREEPRRRKQAARGGPARGQAHRHRMDRQEAGGQRPPGADLSAMRPTSIAAIYVLFWTLSLFLVLPWGVRTSEEEGVRSEPGHAESAPHLFRAGRVVLWTTLVATLLFGLYYANYVYGWVTVDQIDWLN